MTLPLMEGGSPKLEFPLESFGWALKQFSKSAVTEVLLGLILAHMHNCNRSTSEATLKHQKKEYPGDCSGVARKY